jgi:hypothetical protein
MKGERELSTADLARPREELRGRSEEQVIAREQRDDTVKADAPAPSTAPVPSPAGRPDTARAARESTVAAGDARTALFPEDQARLFHNRWTEVQSGFVDEPRAAVEHADSLVAEVMKKLAEGFAGERASLEKQWARGDNVTTEELRVALQRYRSFFDRLLKV